MPTTSTPVRSKSQPLQAVRTTGIYCRATCAARPLSTNVDPRQHQADALAAGYRPCLRCRPDRLPLVAISPETDPVLGQALAAIADGYLDRHGEAALAKNAGVSARHLRRLFQAAIGTTPTQLAIYRRAHFARHLLDDTDLNVTTIAHASGFGSLRQMNAVILRVFRRTPRELRARRTPGDRGSIDGGIPITIEVPGHDHAAWLDALRRSLVPGVESICDEVYRRSTNVCGHPGVVEILPLDDEHVRVLAHLPAIGGIIDEVARSRRLLGVDTNSAPGRHPWTPAEGAIRRRAREVHGSAAELWLAYLASACGTPVPGALGAGITHEFPALSSARAALGPWIDT
jgi:AraC family transcriptional regulator of adaptative response / DNA-3-methyladenine glycosylase II